jgi:thiamine pyrophosphate-dependent acetolactate synthase large subunit-like protein
LLRVEVHFRGGSVMEVEVEDFETFQAGIAHKISAISFQPSRTARQYVPHLDFEEVVAVKVTELDEELSGGQRSLESEHADQDSYDKLLDDYSEHLDVMRRLVSMQGGGEIPPSSKAEEQWRASLERLRARIGCTTDSLDVLEERNPSMLTSERITRRIELAAHYSELSDAVG